VVVFALLAATALIGRPFASTHPLDSWFPTDGYRARLSSEQSEDIAYFEWSRPDGLSLANANILGYSAWVYVTDPDPFETRFTRLHIVNADPTGETTAIADTIWTLDTDGARAVIDYSFVEIAGLVEARVAFLVPGRLDLPVNPVAGQTWVSKGQAVTMDRGEVFKNDYKASFVATASARPTCLDVTMDYQVGTVSRWERRTWCPGLGIVDVADSRATWGLTMAAVSVEVDPITPINFAALDNLTFDHRIINAHAYDPTISPRTSPGLLSGGAVFVDRNTPDLRFLRLNDQAATIGWDARPGGHPTASATFGSLTVVANTNRQLVAYNSDGRWVWEARLSDITMVPPVRVGDLVMVVALDGTVSAFELASGALSWRANMGVEIRSAPVAAGEKILVANQAGALACFDLQGRQLWVADAGIPQAMVVSLGPDPVIVYAAQNSMILRAYSLADGHPVWRHRVYENALDLIGLDQILVLRNNAVVLGINWSSGAVLWRWADARAYAAIGGGKRVLLLAESELILLADGGWPVQRWPHELGDVTGIGVFLVADADAVLAIGPKGIEIAVLP
jgi:outer membrane protein assembly factor BamB